jgi:hypothetical protein
LSPAALPEKVSVPLNELTELPSQLIVALPPIARVSPLDEVWPLFGTKSGEPGAFDAKAPAAPGPTRAAPARPATTSHERDRAIRDLRGVVAVCIVRFPE